jgi:signal transduction histidine kinase
MRMQGITLTSTVPDIVMAAIGFSEMSQIVTNLLINARDAVLERTDGADRNIYVSVADGETVSVIIEDNGPGVPDEILPRLYDAFVTTKELGKGTGLGLWIVRSLLDDANGDITAANTGNGLRITVTLPRPQEGTK